MGTCSDGASITVPVFYESTKTLNNLNKRISKVNLLINSINAKELFIYRNMKTYIHQPIGSIPNNNRNVVSNSNLSKMFNLVPMTNNALMNKYSVTYNIRQNPGNDPSQ
jgi:hypothetical protein